MKDDKDNVKSDYDYSRETYYDLLEKGREAMEDMIHVARESEHPRAYEVLSNMIKNLSDVNDKLMDLNKKNKEITQQPKQVENQQNNFFVGSTADLQKMLQNENVIEHDSKE
jgi:ABC-type proline/glycine betaine transport system substrate-binding protein